MKRDGGIPESLPLSEMSLYDLPEAYVLLRRNWEVREGDHRILVPSERGGALRCMDGRQVFGWGSGAAVQGGALGVAALSTNVEIEEKDIIGACNAIIKNGLVPTVHGDKAHGTNGCGFGKNLFEGRMHGLPRLLVPLDRVRNIVYENEGDYVDLEGYHTEGLLRVNLVPTTTVQADGSAFHIDPWIAEYLGIDPIRMIENAAETIEILNGSRVAEIIR